MTLWCISPVMTRNRTACTLRVLILAYAATRFISLSSHKLSNSLSLSQCIYFSYLMISALRRTLVNKWVTVHYRNKRTKIERCRLSRISVFSFGKFCNYRVFFLSLFRILSVMTCILNRFSQWWHNYFYFFIFFFTFNEMFYIFRMNVSWIF